MEYLATEYWRNLGSNLLQFVGVVEYFMKLYTKVSQNPQNLDLQFMIQVILNPVLIF